MNDYFKKIIICFCIVGFLFSPLRPKPVNAVVGVDDCIVIGGVLVTTYVVVLALEKAGAFQGFDIDSNYSGDFRNYLSEKVLALSAAEIAKYFFTAKDSSGNDYVSLSSYGYDYSYQVHYDLIHDSPIYKFEHSTDLVTSNTDKTQFVPFMLNNYYMTPYHFSNGVAYTTFEVNLGDTLYFQYSNDCKNFYQKTYVASVYNTVRLYQDGVYLRLQYYNGSSWVSSSSVGNCSTSSDVAFGYYTTSNTVYAPSTDVVTTGGNVVDIGDSAVAVPISGQYDSASGQTIYDGIEGGTANAISGLKASDLSITTPIDTGTGSDASFWSELWDWLEKIYNGIRSIPGAIEALPGEIATSFENALQYVFVPTATDFSDFYNYIEDDVKLKFPYSVSILNSLEVNADEFTDIHVTIWGHDCVIVSAQFVNNNISFIRVVTSCFWIFSLFVYVWRKINAVLNGGDVNSTTVYAPGGGGSGPPSVI